MTEKDKLFPGDFIANEEEFTPGKGAYTDNGQVKAATYGKVEKDSKQREARVEACTHAPKIMEQDLVVTGVFSQVRDNVAFVALFPFKEGKIRWVAPPNDAVLRVANVRRGFVKSLKDEFLIGDIVRVKIMYVDEQSVVLTTDGKNLGVIKAFCDICRNPMELKKGEIQCPKCSYRGHRKLADDYGMGVNKA